MHESVRAPTLPLRRFLLTIFAGCYTIVVRRDHLTFDLLVFPITQKENTTKTSLGLEKKYHPLSPTPYHHTATLMKVVSFIHRAHIIN